MHGFRPKLVAILSQSLQIDLAHCDRPESPRAGRVREIARIFAAVDGADVDAAPRLVRGVVLISRSLSIVLSAEEALDRLDIGLFQPNQLGNLVYPSPRRLFLLFGIVPLDRLIGEVLVAR